MALRIEHILENIVYHLDLENDLPSEPAPARRRPMSLAHARLTYPDEASAQRAWADACAERERESREIAAKDFSSKSNKRHNHFGNVYSCLFVSRAFNAAARRVLAKRVHFTNEDTWNSYVNSTSNKSMASTLVLHKLKTASQEQVVKFSEKCTHDGTVQSRISWLEFYVCPQLIPPINLLSSSLQRLSLPGCSLVNDKYLMIVAAKCPLLSTLDLRACEEVSDEGIEYIAQSCPKITYFNVGRVSHGERITSRAVAAIARGTQIDTLGLAGCHVGDDGIWALAISAGSRILRLSLNGCSLLSDASIPLVVDLMPKLQVLELRGVTRITNMRPLVFFKYRQRPLLEGCEVFEQRMRDEELELRKHYKQNHIRMPQRCTAAA